MVVMSDTPRRLRRPPRPWTMQRVLFVLVAFIGCSLLLYPTAASWFSTRHQATEVKSYVEATEQLDAPERRKLLEEAKKYNEQLPGGPLRDPYTLDQNGQRVVVGSGSEAYNGVLDLGLGGLMGHISVPSIDVSLPVFHGTTDETLARGAGHIFGSSLPVGGDGTHSVITAHSGFVNAILFNDLKKVAIGDLVTMTVLEEKYSYKVDAIEVVLPEDTDKLRQVPGHDYLTLLTCTPTGVNSHRLLVRGERVPNEENGTSVEAPSQVAMPGFPWWAVILAGAVAGSVLITKPRR